MTSEDVIHDLYLPALRLKQDILPGRYTYLWFTATKTGTFHLTCAEFCGTDHSVMAGQLVIVAPQDYARWTAAQPEGDDLAHQGAALFASLGCSGCHNAPGAVVHAPDLHGVYGHLVQLSDGRTVMADEAYLRDKILLPNRDIPAGYAPDMPSFRGVVERGGSGQADRLPQIARRAARASKERSNDRDDIAVCAGRRDRRARAISTKATP